MKISVVSKEDYISLLHPKEYRHSCLLSFLKQGGFDMRHLSILGDQEY